MAEPGIDLWLLSQTRYTRMTTGLLSTPMGVDYVVIGFDMELPSMQLDLYA